MQSNAIFAASHSAGGLTCLAGGYVHKSIEKWARVTFKFVKRLVGEVSVTLTILSNKLSNKNILINFFITKGRVTLILQWMKGGVSRTFQ